MHTINSASTTARVAVHHRGRTGWIKLNHTRTFKEEFYLRMKRFTSVVSQLKRHRSYIQNLTARCWGFILHGHHNKPAPCTSSNDNIKQPSTFFGQCQKREGCASWCVFCLVYIALFSCKLQLRLHISLAVLSLDVRSPQFFVYWHSVMGGRLPAVLKAGFSWRLLSWILYIAPFRSKTQTK